MARELSVNQEARIEGKVRRPQYFVYLELDQPYYWSTHYNQTWNDNYWQKGNIIVDSVSSERANFRIKNTDYRFTDDAILGNFQLAKVRLWWAYPSDNQLYVEGDYWDEDYVDDYEAPEPILMFDGWVFSTPDISEWLTVEAQRTLPRFYPFTKIRSPIANHLPGDGYMITFDGQILRVEGGR